MVEAVAWAREKITVGSREKILSMQDSEVEKNLKATVGLPFMSREQALTSDLLSIRRNQESSELDKIYSRLQGKI